MENLFVVYLHSRRGKGIVMKDVKVQNFHLIEAIAPNNVCASGYFTGETQEAQCQGWYFLARKCSSDPLFWVNVTTSLVYYYQIQIKAEGNFKLYKTVECVCAWYVSEEKYFYNRVFFFFSDEQILALIKCQFRKSRPLYPKVRSYVSCNFYFQNPE